MLIGKDNIGIYPVRHLADLLFASFWDRNLNTEP
jgi:hypothetical protein